MAKEYSITQIIDEEYLPDIRLPSGPLKPQPIQASAIELFHHLPDDSDARWRIAAAWTQANSDSRSHGIHREAALQAIHLSPNPSFRNEYGRYFRAPNLRQLCRATHNLRVFPELQAMAPQALPEVPKGYQLEVGRTAKVTRGTGQDQVTGCPEAVNQIRLFQTEPRTYLARVGFNLHRETDTPIVSITNLQGTPNHQSQLEEFSDRAGVSPFNLLVRATINLVQAVLPDASVRGLKNPQANSGLINTVLKKEGIPRLSFHKSLGITVK